MDPGPGMAALQAWGGQVAAYGASNQTVVDKVPPELLHLVDPYWLVLFLTHHQHEIRIFELLFHLSLYSGTNSHL